MVQFLFASLMLAGPVDAEVTRSQLQNGMKLLTCSTQAGDQVALVVLYSIGDDHDPAGQSGLAHLVEHLHVTAAAGNAKPRTADEFVQNYPLGWNAQTGPDYSVFATVFARADLEKEIIDAAARMGDLRPASTDLDREKPRMLQELADMYGGSTPLAVFNHTRERLRPSAIGHRKGGLADQIERLSLEDAKTWWADYYKPANATVVLAGAFDSAAARSLIEKHFGQIPAGKNPPQPKAPAPAKTGQLDIVQLKASDTGRPHVGIGFPAPPPGDENYIPTLLLVSRMWARNTAPDDPQVIFNLLDEPTVIVVTAPLRDSETPEQAVMRLRSAIDDAAVDPIAPADRALLKRNTAALLGVGDYSAVMLQQNLYGAAFSIGRCEQLGVNRARIAAEVEALDDEKFRNAVVAIFDPDRQAAVVVAPE